MKSMVQESARKSKKTPGSEMLGPISRERLPVACLLMSSYLLLLNINRRSPDAVWRPKQEDCLENTNKRKMILLLFSYGQRQARISKSSTRPRDTDFAKTLLVPRTRSYSYSFILQGTAFCMAYMRTLNQHVSCRNYCGSTYAYTVLCTIQHKLKTILSC